MSGVSDPAETSSAFSHSEILSIIFGLMLAMFLAALDQTIVATALPTIGADLGDFVNLSWVVTAYLLASTTVTPLYGKLSDIHGRGVVLLVAIALFSIGSLACAMSQSMLMLIVSRGLQGLGGGGLISLAQTVIADVVSPRERGRYQGYFASVFAVSSIAGPVVGGVFAQHVHWSLIFWINIPLGLAAFLVMRKMLGRLPRHGRPHELDFLGCGLMVVSSTTLLLAMTSGGVHYPWTSPEILSLLAVSVVTGILFVWRMRTASEPFLPLSILADPVVGNATGAACFIYGTMIALTIMTPLYFETARGFSASMAGMALIPQMAATVVGAVAGGRAMALLTHYKRPAVAGMVLAVACLLAAAVIPADLPVWIWVVLLTVASVGMGMVFPISTVCIQNAVPLHLLGTATGAANFFRALGGALMVALLGAVFIGALGVSETGDFAQLAHGADQGKLHSAFSLVFGGGAAALACGLVFLIAMKELPLRATVREAAEAMPIE
ncbi:MDR family MFS transporter [Aquabacter sp. CN5-332]|uniref:MDR family MFS transporter n=1 Tax=Aquabacter sp. CN5-332 TaxID=3156608 RepID=UPI0032B55759